MSVLKAYKQQKVIYCCLRSYTEDQKENYHENKFGSYKSNKKLLYLKPRSWTRSHQLFWRCIKILPRPVQWSFGGLSKRVERKACPASDPAQKINNNKKPAKTFRNEKGNRYTPHLCFKTSQPDIKQLTEQANPQLRPRKCCAGVLGRKRERKKNAMPRSKDLKEKAKAKKDPKKKQKYPIWCLVKHLNHMQSCPQSKQHPNLGHRVEARVSWAEKEEREECLATKSRSKEESS